MSVDGRSKVRRAGAFLQTVYLHTASVVGTIGLAAVIAKWGVEWQGAIREIITYWDLLVRKPLASVLDILLYPFGLLLGWHIAVPALLVDYLALGMILWLSLNRVQRRPLTGGSAVDAILSVLIWPILFLVHTIEILRMPFALALGPFERSLNNQSRRESILILAPALYLGLLLTINYAFL